MMTIVIATNHEVKRVLETFDWTNQRGILEHATYDWMSQKEILLPETFDWTNRRGILQHETYDWMSPDGISQPETSDWMSPGEILERETSDWKNHVAWEVRMKTAAGGLVLERTVHVWTVIGPTGARLEGTVDHQGMTIMTVVTEAVTLRIGAGVTVDHLVTTVDHQERTAGVEPRLVTVGATVVTSVVTCHPVVTDGVTVCRRHRTTVTAGARGGHRRLVTTAMMTVAPGGVVGVTARGVVTTGVVVVVAVVVAGVMTAVDQPGMSVDHRGKTEDLERSVDHPEMIPDL